VRIATWNVNSVKQRVSRLLPWLDERRPDVVCLQETKLADDAFLELLGDELDNRGYAVAVHGETAWNGVAILSRVGLDDVRPASRGAGVPSSGGARDRRDVRRNPSLLRLRPERAGARARTTTATSSPGSRHCATSWRPARKRRSSAAT
jgi:exonuclease III